MPTSDNDTITLRDAASHYGFTVSTLRAEADRGKLTIYKIGKRFYTTPADIKEMVLQCRVARKVQGSISTLREGNGSSETERTSAAHNAVKEMLSQRKNSSRNTSAENTNRRIQARR